MVDSKRGVARPMKVNKMPMSAYSDKLPPQNNGDARADRARNRDSLKSQEDLQTLGETHEETAPATAKSVTKRKADVEKNETPKKRKQLESEKKAKTNEKPVQNQSSTKTGLNQSQKKQETIYEKGDGDQFGPGKPAEKNAPELTPEEKEAAKKAEEYKKKVVDIMNAVAKKEASELASRASSAEKFSRGPTYICFTQEGFEAEAAAMVELRKKLLKKGFPKGCPYLIDLSTYTGHVNNMIEYLPSAEAMDLKEYESLTMPFILRKDIANAPSVEALGMVYDDAEGEFGTLTAKIKDLNIEKNKLGKGHEVAEAKQQLGAKVYALGVRANLFVSIKVLAQLFRKKKGYVEPEPEDGAASKK